MKHFLAFLLAILATAALGSGYTAGPYRISLRTEPAVIPVGRAKVIVTVADTSGKPVVDAVVKVLVQMPGMPMGERETTAMNSGTPGTYSAPAIFAMAGAYDATVAIQGNRGAAQATIQLSTGESAGEGSALPLLPIAAGAAVLLGIVLLYRQAKLSGQPPSLRRILTPQTVVSLAILGIALTAAVWAVNTHRRPGSMTPLEAQVMDMNAPAPEGSLPVNLAVVESKPFNPTVSYSGQAVGFVEQDIVARVGGAIVWMPFYVGDRVSKGQIVARLDTTQIDPMVSERAAQSVAASQGIGIAQSDYQKALAEVSEAEAEQAIRVGAIDEAKAMVGAAQQEQLSAEANLRMEQASVNDSRGQITSAEADRTYWIQEFERTRQLFSKGAVSKDDLQKAQTSATGAEAKVRSAQAGIDAATARVQSARAAVSKAAAQVTAAQNKMREMQAEHHSHMAHVESARAGAHSAKQRIAQAISESRVARASLEGASTQRGYAELRAESDGVVTSRSVSPGVVISPGQAVLRVAQVAPIRLQANVPEADLARINVGAIAMVRRRDTAEPATKVTVTSISPAIDPNSRMGVVEALYPNTDGRFKPGQFVSMKISVGDTGRALVIPDEAIQIEGDQTYAWVAEPSVNNTYAVSRHAVKIGQRAENLASIVSGLSAGQRVVLTPPQGLVAGGTVTSEFRAPANGAAKAEQTVEITAAGYSPPSLVVPSEKPFKVTFIRRDDKSCGTEVIFPDLGIRKALPLNEPVTIDIPAQPAGKELHFTCPMNMLNGKAVAQ